jgi:hypothetical protein
MDSVEGKLQLCESVIVHTFNEKLLLCKALPTSCTFIKWRGEYTRVQKNARLAVYSDTALNMALCHLLYHQELNKSTITLSLFSNVVLASLTPLLGQLDRDQKPCLKYKTRGVLSMV